MYEIRDLALATGVTFKKKQTLFNYNANLVV